MAEVFLADVAAAQGLSKQVVIKKIHPALAESGEFVSMFVDEAKIALGLNHPNIVQVFDFGSTDDTYFLVMELVDGLDLMRLSDHLESGPYPEPRPRAVPCDIAAHIIQETAKGLDYAHRKTDNFGAALGIVHRDVSPQNILVSWDGAVKLVDFGIARARDVHEEEGVIKGKFAYMSPEQARGELVDRRSDVFALGAVLFELVCGQPLFKGSGRGVLRRVQNAEFPKAIDVDPSLPRSLCEIIDKALAEAPEHRWQTARDLQSALGRFGYDQARDGTVFVDSAVLAQFLARSIPAPSERRRQRRPPSAEPQSTTDLPQATTPPASPTLTQATVTSSKTAQPTRSENKYVFVIRGHVCGLAELAKRVGPERSRAIVNSYIDMARDIAFKHHAHVSEANDASVSIVVGMPISAEDDAYRAIALALALVDALDGIGHDVEPTLRLAVGIQRGSARIDWGDRDFTYELGHQAAADAQLLASSAQGAEILVGARVFQMAKDEWTFDELTNTATSSGDRARDTEKSSTTSQHTRVYRLKAAKDRIDRMTTSNGAGLFGRELEQKTLRDAYLEICSAESRHSLLITGEDGVGKGSLLADFLAGIPRDETVLLRAGARIATSHTPYGLLADLVRDFLGLADGAEPREVIRRVESAASLLYPAPQDEAQSRAAVQAMCQILGAGQANDQTKHDADAMRQRLSQILGRIERTLAPGRPLILVLEDLHWGDHQSLAVFGKLLRLPTNRAIMAVATARSEARVLEIARRAGLQVLRVGELDRDSSIALVKRRFTSDEDVTQLAERIIAQTGGYPTFINEVLEYLIECGVVGITDENSHHGLRWLDRSAHVEVPSSIQAAMEARLSRLPESTRELVCHAAVLGQVVNARLLEVLVSADPRPDLTTLCSRGVLRSVGHDHYEFSNTTTMSVAYSSLPDEDRRVFHLRAAEAVSNSPSYSVGHDEAMIARHLELAGDPLAAAKRYHRAAECAVDVGGHDDALRQLTRALRLLEDAPSDNAERNRIEFDLRRLREIIHSHRAEPDCQIEELQHLRRLAQVLAAPKNLAYAHARTAAHFLWHGRLTEASQSLSRTVRHARRGSLRLAEANGLRLQATLVRFQGNSARALELCTHALSLCRDESGARHAQAQVLHTRGTTHRVRGELSHALDDYTQALQTFQLLALPRDEAMLLGDLAKTRADLGDVDGGLRDYEHSLQIDIDLGDDAASAVKLADIALMYAILGDESLTRRTVSKTLACPQRNVSPALRADLATALANVAMRMGDDTNAAAHLGDAETFSQTSGDRFRLVRADLTSCEYRLSQGNFIEALNGAQSVIEEAEELGAHWVLPAALLVCGRALAAIDRTQEALTATRRAVSLLDSGEAVSVAHEALYFHASVCEQGGQVPEATAALRKAQQYVDHRTHHISNAAMRQQFQTSTPVVNIARALQRLAAD